MNWSSKCESRGFFGLAAADPFDGIPESSFPSKDILSQDSEATLGCRVPMSAATDLHAGVAEPARP